MRFLPMSRGLASLAAVAVLATASFAQTVDDKPEVKAQVLDTITRLLSTRAYVPGLDFGKWKEFSDKEKSKFDSSKNDDDFGMAVNEAFAKFGASHIALITPKYTDMRNTGSTVGIGVSTMKTPDGTLIVRTVPGAGAEKAGLIAGDVITKVDGQPADGPKGIPGPEGTTVNLTVKHANGKSVDYTVTRSKFSTRRPEELIKVDNDTARLAIYTFDISYDRDNVESLMKKAQKYKNLIVDLRDNGGGAVVNLQHLLGMLIPSDESVGTFVSKSLVNDYVEKADGKPKDVVKAAAWSRGVDDWEGQQIKPLPNRNVPVYTGHLAVLVNRFSGSASEICAAALRDLVGAQVVGTKSAGAVLVSVIVPATNGFSLQYPIMDYVTVKGLRIEGNGVAPAAEVEDPKYRLPDTKDPVVDKAVALLEKATLHVSE